jgi:hypothetical protein
MRYLTRPTLLAAVLWAWGCGGNGARQTPEAGAINDAAPLPTNCPSRCQAKADACQAPPAVSGPLCTQLCALGLSEQQLSCFEAADCAALATLQQGGGVCGITSGQQDAGATPSADKGNIGGCPIPEKSLKVSFPYFYASSSNATLVEVAGLCEKNGEQGYTGATVLHALKDKTTSVKIESIAGLLHQIDFVLAQQEVSALVAISTQTGIPTAALQKGKRMIVSVTKSTTALDPLPTGVTPDVFLPSSTSEPGFVRFSSQSKPDLEAVLSQLSNGIRLETRMKPFSGSGAQYTYQLKVKKSYPRLEVLGIQRQ